jgi:hypothetical protein
MLSLLQACFQSLPTPSDEAAVDVIHSNLNQIRQGYAIVRELNCSLEKDFPLAAEFVIDHLIFCVTACVSLLRSLLSTDVQAKAAEARSAKLVGLCVLDLVVLFPEVLKSGFSEFAGLVSSDEQDAVRRWLVRVFPAGSDAHCASTGSGGASSDSVPVVPVAFSGSGGAGAVAPDVADYAIAPIRSVALDSAARQAIEVLRSLYVQYTRMICFCSSEAVAMLTRGPGWQTAPSIPPGFPQLTKAQFTCMGVSILVGPLCLAGDCAVNAVQYLTVVRKFIDVVAARKKLHGVKLPPYGELIGFFRVPGSDVSSRLGQRYGVIDDDKKRFVVDHVAAVFQVDGVGPVLCDPGYRFFDVALPPTPVPTPVPASLAGAISAEWSPCTDVWRLTFSKGTPIYTDMAKTGPLSAGALEKPCSTRHLLHLSLAGATYVQASVLDDSLLSLATKCDDAGTFPFVHTLGGLLRVMTRK